MSFDPAFFHSLSLRDKLAQLLFVRIGSNLPPVRTVEDDAERVADLLRKFSLGGLLLFNGQSEKTTQTLERLQATSRIPLLIGADIERGIGQQLRGYTLFPHAMAFDALGEDAAAQVFEFARLTSLAARAHGIHMTFSPVADVNSDPRNPIIATRAFGNNPQRVAELVSAYVAGSKAGGALAAAKHFPGHGNTHEDSHHALPSVKSSRQELDACDLVPFQAAIDSDIPLVMTAHVQFPAFDPTGNPATLSAPMLKDLLRGELNFQGAVVSDSLLMEGVKSRFENEGQMVLHALLAGVDLLLDVNQVEDVLMTLEQAVDSGQLPIARVEEALSRIASLKTAAFSLSKALPTDKPLADIIDQSRRLATTVAQQSIKVLSGSAQGVKLDTNLDLLVVMLRPNQSHLDPPVQPFGEFVSRRFSKCEYFELRPDSTAEDYAILLARGIAAKQVLIAMIVKPAAWYRFGLLPEQDVFVRELTAKRGCVLASLGSPVALDSYPDASVKICAYSDVFVSQEALAKSLSAN